MRKNRDEWDNLWYATDKKKRFTLFPFEWVNKKNGVLDKKMISFAKKVLQEKIKFIIYNSEGKLVIDKMMFQTNIRGYGWIGSTTLQILFK